MNTEFEKRLQSVWPRSTWQDVRVLVAVSGGADSVALLRALVANCSHEPAHFPDNIIVAHFNHQWRGQESDDDAQYVIKLAEKIGLECVVGNPDSHPGDPESGSQRKPSEDAARRQRYAFLQQVAEELGARYLVTAHTGDDQAETVLHRILRGTGIGGLAGIPRLRVLSPAVTLVRPLLGFRRHEIRAYLDEIGQGFRDDSSNHDTSYTRNRLRRELIPSLAANYNPDLTGAILRLAELAGEHQQFLSGHVCKLSDSCVLDESTSHIVVDSTKLKDRQPLIVREFFISIWKRKQWPRQAMGFAEWSALYSLGTQDGPAKIILPGRVVCTRDGGTLTLQILP